MSEGLCPHCHSERIVEGRAEGMSFFPKERRSEDFAFVPLWLRSQATLCLACGLLWQHADVEAALRLIQQVGNAELQKRVRGWQKQGSHTLLRPASAPITAPQEILLRPAASASGPAEELLRGAEPQDERAK